MMFASPYVPTISHAIFKEHAEDFVVHEMMEVSLDGQGEHCWLFIQKTNLNTEFVAKLLAKWADIPVRDVGFSGLKDRRAISRQWFSLRLPKRSLPAMPFCQFAQSTLRDEEHLDILEQNWHSKKLGRGTHKANRFTITLKNVIGDKTQIDAQLSMIAKQGVPNYFGEQRFGKEGNNLPQATRFFEKLIATDKPYRPHKKDRHQHALYISVAKSAIFNALLTKRVQMNTWDKPISGDVFNLNGTGSVFCADIDDAITQRMATGDIHPAGILYGTGDRLSSHHAKVLEDETLADFAVFREGLIKLGAKLSHRPYRLTLKDVSWQWQDDTLKLAFTLPTGSFATSVLSAIIEGQP